MESRVILISHPPPKKEPLPLPKKMGMERYKYNTKKKHLDQVVTREAKSREQMEKKVAT